MQNYEIICKDLFKRSGYTAIEFKVNVYGLVDGYNGGYSCPSLINYQFKDCLLPVGEILIERNKILSEEELLLRVEKIFSISNYSTITYINNESNFYGDKKDRINGLFSDLLTPVKDCEFKREDFIK